MSEGSRKFFSDRRVVFALATLCCMLWGSAYPAIKNGYLLFAIAPDDIPGKLVFAGYRFLFAGLVLLLLAAFLKKNVFALQRQDWLEVSALGMIQTAIQYVFFYIGLAHTTGVKGSIMNATAVFFGVLLAHFFYRNDRLNARKAIGCLIGFGGVMVVNFRPELLDLNFSLLGEGFVTIAALILSIGMVYGKRLSQRMDSTVMTGHQLTIGGLALLLAGFATGGELHGFNLKANLLLGYLVLLSSAAFALWSVLLKYNRVGMVTVFNFLVPVFGALLSAIFLNETILEWKNAVALALVCYGIWLVTQEDPPPAA